MSALGGWLRGRRLFASIAVGLLAVGLTIGVAQRTSAPASAAGPLVFTYEVRGLDNRSRLDVFATEAAQTYADARGWSLGGSIAFRRVAAGGNFTLWLAAAARVPSFGSPCDSSYSCRIGRNVVINEDRWLGATPAWTGGGRSLRDYRNLVVNHETGHWLGFGHATCGGAGQLAPVMQQQSISLQGCRPNDWPLAWERQRLASQRHVAIITGLPIGHLDAVTGGLNEIRVQGWAFDPERAAAAIQVHVYVDGAGRVAIANRPRPDVARIYPAAGPNHGFDYHYVIGAGTHQVCAYAINLIGPVINPNLGCRTVVLTGSPAGHLDAVTAVGTTGTARGWVIDPDTANPAQVHVYVDGHIKTAAVANGVRADVAAIYPRFGTRHGFAVSFAVPRGVHQVCVFGINVAGPGGNITLGCPTVRIA